MQEDSYQYGGTHLISMEKDSHQYAGRPSLVLSKTLISTQEDPQQYGGRHLIVCRKTGKRGEDTNEAYLATQDTTQPVFFCRLMAIKIRQYCCFDPSGSRQLPIRGVNQRNVRYHSSKKRNICVFILHRRIENSRY